MIPPMLHKKWIKSGPFSYFDLNAIKIYQKVSAHLNFVLRQRNAVTGYQHSCQEFWSFGTLQETDQQFVSHVIHHRIQSCDTVSDDVIFLVCHTLHESQFHRVITLMIFLMSSILRVESLAQNPCGNSNQISRWDSTLKYIVSIF